jgi:hypothetical protein
MRECDVFKGEARLGKKGWVFPLQPAQEFFDIKQQTDR